MRIRMFLERLLLGGLWRMKPKTKAGEVSQHKAYILALMREREKDRST
jgi:hypothetical protein